MSRGVSRYRVCARSLEGVVELHIDLRNLKGEWVEVFQSDDPNEVQRYLATRTDPGAEISWEVEEQNRGVFGEPSLNQH